MKSDELGLIEMLRGEVAWQEGKFEEAYGHFRQAEETDPLAASAVRIALLHNRRDEAEQREANFELATKRAEIESAKLQAWVELQRGVVELENGDYRAARAHFQSANARFSGWFLIEEHLAETEAAPGNHPVACAT